MLRRGFEMTNTQTTVKDIAEMTGLNINTIRRWADRGYIESKRDYKGWRIFPDPTKTVRRINGLLAGDIELKASHSEMR
jgi:DNA-binding transcriptional MerR regulator